MRNAIVVAVGTGVLFWLLPAVSAAAPVAVWHLDAPDGKPLNGPGEVGTDDLGGAAAGSLKGLWHFEAGTGATAADASGNANTGTLDGPDLALGTTVTTSAGSGAAIVDGIIAYAWQLMPGGGWFQVDMGATRGSAITGT